MDRPEVYPTKACRGVTGRRAPLSIALAIVSAISAHEARAQAAPPEPTFGTTVVVPGGLHGTVYFIPKDSKVLPDFTSANIERVGEIWTNTLNVPPRHWRGGFPGLTGRFEWFAIDYNGRFWIERPGRYLFALLSDDGSRLFIDETPVIDNDCQHPPDLRLAAVQLEGGVHQIRVSYFQGPRDCLSLLLAIAGPDGQWRVFDATELKPPSNPDAWRFPEAGKMAIVPVTPAEASLNMTSLLERLVRADPAEKRLIDRKAGSGCFTAGARICTN